MKILIMAISTLLFIGCSQYINHPIQLEDSTRQNISLNVLSEHKNSVPKDQFLVNQNWHYKQTKKHGYGYFFANDEIVETFYLAHNASHIYIRGNAHTIKKYKKYFIDNQVRAKIILIPLHRNRRGYIRIDYYNITPSIVNKIDVNSEEARGGKNLLPPSSKVIEIDKKQLKRN